MHQFITYFNLGLGHILDPTGIDHILFVIALAVIYTEKDWKKILWLVTAFTMGHSITLVLAAIDLITIDASVVEILIPFTIVIAAISNIYIYKSMSFS